MAVQGVGDQLFAGAGLAIDQYGDVSVLDTPTFFFGLTPGEEVNVEIEPGKILVIRLIHVGAANDDGIRTVSFELNGLPREIDLKDKNVKATGISRKKADKNNPGEIAATLSGSVVKVFVDKGQRVAKGDPLVVTEAMKMETTIVSPLSGIVAQVNVGPASRIESGDCLLEIDINTQVAMK